MSNFDLFLFAGHGTSEKDNSYDSGAVNGNTHEHDLATKIRDKAIEYLKPLGYNIHIDEQNYKDNDTSGNSYRLKWGLSIHINAGGGTGSEVLVPLGEKDFSIELNILGELAKLGLVSRGIKSRDYDTEATTIRANGVKAYGNDYYGEIRNAWKQGVSLTILEVGFIDNSKDLSIILNEIDKIAFIIASSIAKYDGKVLTPPNAPKPPVSPPSEIKGDIFYRVVCGSFQDKINALKRMEELKRAGFKDYFLDIYRK